MLWRGSFRQTCMSQIPLPWSLHVALSSALSPVKQDRWGVEGRRETAELGLGDDTGQAGESSRISVLI